MVITFILFVLGLILGIVTESICDDDDVSNLCIGIIWLLAILIPNVCSIGGYKEENNVYELMDVSAKTTDEASNPSYLISSDDSYIVKCSSLAGGTEIKQISKKDNVKILEVDNYAVPSITIEKTIPRGGIWLTYKSSETTYTIIIPTGSVVN